MADVTLNLPKDAVLAIVRRNLIEVGGYNAGNAAKVADKLSALALDVATRTAELKALEESGDPDAANALAQLAEWLPTAANTAGLNALAKNRDGAAKLMRDVGDWFGVFAKAAVDSAVPGFGPIIAAAAHATVES